MENFVHQFRYKKDLKTYDSYIEDHSTLKQEKILKIRNNKVIMFRSITMFTGCLSYKVTERTVTTFRKQLVNKTEE